MKEIELSFDFNAFDSDLEEYRISIPKGFEVEINENSVVLKKECSKDEEIRKELINYFTEGREFLSLCSFGRDEILAWLEKQCNVDSQVILPTFTFDDILALQCCMETVKKVQEDKVLYKKLNDLHSRVYDAYHFEKQESKKKKD